MIKFIKDKLACLIFGLLAIGCLGGMILPKLIWGYTNMKLIMTLLIFEVFLVILFNICLNMAFSTNVDEMINNMGKHIK